jgi:hypothetical protein
VRNGKGQGNLRMLPIGPTLEVVNG